MVARGELLDSFRLRQEYFNTFGGNPVSCAVAEAVLQVIEEEGLVHNAAEVGEYVLRLFQELQSRHEIIGDVRGRGLFFGMDLVSDRKTKAAASEQTKRVVNAMRHKGVLMGNIGQHGNVLKLRPPLCFSKENADFLVSALDQVLSAE